MEGDQQRHREGNKRARDDATSDAEAFEFDVATYHIETGKRRGLDTAEAKTSQQKYQRKEEEGKKDMQKCKMIKIKGEWTYEEDLIENEKEIIKAAEDRYKPSHVGLKIVEATLNPSARSGNNDANKLKFLKYVHEKKFKVDSVKTIGFGRVELTFNDYRDANRCLAEKHKVIKA